MSSDMNRKAGGSVLDAIHHIRRRLLPTLAVLAVGVGACDDVAPPIEIDGTGTVEGLVFFDVDEDRLFDPADGDSPIAGVGVAIQNRGTGQSFSGGATSTGNDGRFRLEDIPVGTHDLRIDTLTVPAGVSVCENPQRVTVEVGLTTFEQVRGRSACLITIAEAQELEAGEFAVVRGVVTAFPGMFDEGDGTLQDETGAIWLFDGSLDGAGLQLGDLVEVGGFINLDVDAFQMSDVTIRSVTPGFEVPEPREVTTADIAAANTASAPLQNILVTVRAAELLSGFTSGGDRNANIDDGSGTTIIRVESGISDSGDAILATLGMTVGNCYDITGVVGSFFGDGEIFPRQVEDVVEVPCN